MNTSKKIYIVLFLFIGCQLDNKSSMNRKEKLIDPDQKNFNFLKIDDNGFKVKFKKKLKFANEILRRKINVDEKFDYIKINSNTKDNFLKEKYILIPPKKYKQGLKTYKNLNLKSCKKIVTKNRKNTKKKYEKAKVNKAQKIVLYTGLMKNSTTDFKKVKYVNVSMYNDNESFKNLFGIRKKGKEKIKETNFDNSKKKILILSLHLENNLKNILKKNSIKFKNYDPEKLDRLNDLYHNTHDLYPKIGVDIVVKTIFCYDFKKNPSPIIDKKNKELLEKVLDNSEIVIKERTKKNKKVEYPIYEKELKIFKLEYIYKNSNNKKLKWLTEIFNSRHGIIFSGENNDELYSFKEIKELMKLGINGKKNFNFKKSPRRIIKVNDNMGLAYTDFVTRITVQEHKDLDPFVCEMEFSDDFL